MPSDFPELVEHTRQTVNDICEKAKVVLRSLLPGIDALQNDKAHFSPRLMLLMLSRTGNQLSPDDRDRLRAALQHAEAFQPELAAWMTVAKNKSTPTGIAENLQQCRDALELATKHLSELDALLAKFHDGQRAS